MTDENDTEESCEEPECEAVEGLDIFCETLEDGKQCKLIMGKMLKGEIDSKQATKEIMDTVGEEQYKRASEALTDWMEGKVIKKRIGQITDAETNPYISDSIDKEIEEIKKKYSLGSYKTS